MKKKLLFTALLAMFCQFGFAQATAYPLPDIVQCSFEVYDLTVQDPIALGNQDPLNFTVTYFTNAADAEVNADAIANPASYIINGWPEQEIFARVDNQLDGSFDVTSFAIIINTDYWVGDLPNVAACGAYDLQALETGNYFTMPGGGGVQIPEGTIITATTTLYVYSEMGPCSDESSFTITIFPGIIVPASEPFIACDDNSDGTAMFNLAMLTEEIHEANGADTEVTFYETYEDAAVGGNPIPNITSYNNVVANQQTIYCRIMTMMCTEVIEIVLIVADCDDEDTDNTVSGYVIYDTDGDGCNDTDAPAAGLLVYYLSGNIFHYTYTDVNGYYSFINVPNMAVNVFVQSQTESLFTVSPANYVLEMPANAENVNFCLQEPEPVDDVAVYIIPTSIAQPGFNATYSVIFQNYGTTTASGDVTVEFNDAWTDFVSASPAMVQVGNILTLSYTNLLPFETRVISLDFLLMMPGVVDLGDVLTFTANITPLDGDAYPVNNYYTFDQFVTNSWDPNDITVKEGEFITMEQADGYLTYKIRFQNLGNANAHNVKVVTTLDSELDVDTFQPLAASHDYQVNRTDDTVEFIFTGIELPGAEVNEAGSHGYILYRVKPVGDIQLGEVMTAEAAIYFDFNPAIMTNTASTTVANLAGVEDITASVVVYPNPASGKVNLMLQNTTADAIHVKVTDILGKTVLSNTFQTTDAVLDIASLRSGVYFINVDADGKQLTKKLIVK